MSEEKEVILMAIEEEKRKISATNSKYMKNDCEKHLKRLYKRLYKLEKEEMR